MSELEGVKRKRRKEEAAEAPAEDGEMERLFREKYHNLLTLFVSLSSSPSKEEVQKR